VTPTGVERRRGVRWSLLLLLAAAGGAYLAARRGALTPAPNAPPPATAPTSGAPESVARSTPAEQPELRRLAGRVSGGGDRSLPIWVTATDDAGRWLAAVQVDARGHFALAWPSGSESASGWLVADGGPGRSAVAPFAGSAAPVELRLGEPAALEVSIELSDGAPLSDAQTTWTFAGRLGDADGRATAAWRAARAARGEPAATSHAARSDWFGRLSLAGLEPGLYLVEADAGTEGVATALPLLGPRGSLVEVGLGAQVSLVAPLLQLELELLDRRGQAVAGAQFQLHGRDRSGREWTLEWAAEPGGGAARGTLAAPSELVVRAAGPGLPNVEQRLDSAQLQSSAATVVLRSPGLPGLALIRPRALAPDGSEPPFEVRLTRPARPEETLDVALDADGWIGPLEPGPLRLWLEAVGELRPGGPPTPLPFETVELDLDLAPGEARELSVPLWSGPRLELTLESRDPWPLVGRATLDTGTGPVAQSFVDLASGARSTLPEPGRPACSWRTLPAEGRARLALEVEGHRSVEFELELSPDGPRHTIQLEPQRR
jgi:hypothetical protein